MSNSERRSLCGRAGNCKIMQMSERKKKGMEQLQLLERLPAIGVSTRATCEILHIELISLLVVVCLGRR